MAWGHLLLAGRGAALPQRAAGDRGRCLRLPARLRVLRPGTAAVSRPRPDVQALHDSEMAAARAAADPALRWRHLERAHVVSQPFTRLHTRNHLATATPAVSPPA